MRAPRFRKLHHADPLIHVVWRNVTIYLNDGMSSSRTFFGDVPLFRIGCVRRRGLRQESRAAGVPNGDQIAGGYCLLRATTEGDPTRRPLIVSYS
jgi:hypothetical protein